MWWKSMMALELNPRNVRSSLARGKIKIAVIGLGRIGLPTAALFAKSGGKVVGLDISDHVVNETNNGRCRFTDEPGLPALVSKVVSEGKLRATTKAGETIPDSDFVIISVPTPVDSTKTPDYDAVRSAAQTIGRHIRKGSVVIIESTVGPGIVEEVVRPIIESASTLTCVRDFGLASCPERSDPGNIIANMKAVPRVVGAMNDVCADLVGALYHAALGVNVIKVANPKTANAIKLTENLFRDVNIALANEFALLFEKLGIDAIEVIRACASKYNFMPHYPGAGVGGPCVTEDQFVFLVDSCGAHVSPVGTYVNDLVRQKKAVLESWGGAQILRPKEDVLALSFDGNKTVFKKVLWFSKRPYEGSVLDVRLTTNRYLKVTPDHPMVVKKGDGFSVRRAAQLRSGDEIPISTTYTPLYDVQTRLDLIEELQQSPDIPLHKVKVKPNGFHLKDKLEYFSRGFQELGITRSKRHDYYRGNYVPLDVYLRLESWSPPPIPRECLSLYTATGSACHVPAVIDLEEDFWRFIGFYASEGCVYTEHSLRGIRDRIKISFGAHEADLINDCRAILNGWGIEPGEEISNGSHSLRFSSRIFGYVLKKILRCGNNSYNKRVPQQVFFGSKRNVAAFLQGLFRGDGWVEGGRNGQSISLGFATVSVRLFQGVLLLLQRFGTTPTCRNIFSKKSKVPAHALRLTRFEDLVTIQHDVGGLPKLSSALVSYSRMKRKSPGIVDYGSYSTASVRSIAEVDFTGFVYNIEIEDTHTFVSSFGIITHNCLPSNSYYLIVEGVRAGNIPYLIRMAREINDRMPDHVVELVSEALNEAGKTVKGSAIGVLGIAYKPDIKDIQLSPIERICTRLSQLGATLSVYDPMFAGEHVFGLKIQKNLADAVRNADCIVIGTAHKEFKKLSLSKIQKLTRKKAALVDARNVVDPAEAKRAGFSFRGVGRVTVQ
jgi:UDPglucose 6-dehydrogenase